MKGPTTTRCHHPIIGLVELDAPVGDGDIVVVRPHSAPRVPAVVKRSESGSWVLRDANVAHLSHYEVKARQVCGDD